MAWAMLRALSALGFCGSGLFVQGHVRFGSVRLALDGVDRRLQLVRRCACVHPCVRTCTGARARAR
eukprot:11242617-Alexandrium_andersonii.AAC.1